MPDNDSATADVTRRRSFRYYFAAALMAALSEGMFTLASLVVFARTTNSALSIGIALALTTAPSLVLTPFQGVIIDRFDKVRLATGACALRALLMVIVPWLISSDPGRSWPLYGCILLSYVLVYFQLPVFESMLKLLLPSREAMRGTASTQAAWMVGTLGGMIFTGLLVERVGLASAFQVAAGLSALGALLFTRIPLRLAGAAAPATGGPNAFRGSLRRYAAELEDGWRCVVTRRGLLPMVVVAAVVNPMVQALNTLILPFVTTVLKSGPVSVGILEGACGAGSALSAVACVWLARANLGTKGLLLSQLLLVASVGLFATATSMQVASLGYFAVGLFIGNMRILSRSLVLQLSPAELAGRVMSNVSFSSLALGSLTSIAAGWIADRSLSLAYGFIAASLLLPIGATILAGLRTALEAPATAAEGEPHP